YSLTVTTTNANTIQMTSSGDGEFDTEGSGKTSSILFDTKYFPGATDNSSLSFTIFAQTTNNGYCNPATISQNIDIIALPTASITADPIDGCDPLSVNLQAITDADPGADIVWDLGNGTTRTGKDNMRDIDEVFTGHGSYTVNMTVTNTPAKGSCIQ